MKKYQIVAPAKIKYLSAFDSYSGGSNSNFVFDEKIEIEDMTLIIDFKVDAKTGLEKPGSLTLNNINAEDEQSAYGMASRYFTATCFVLSYFAQKQNANQHYGHMQVVWDAAKTTIQPRDQNIPVGMSVITTSYIQATPAEIKTVIERTISGGIPGLLATAFLHSLNDSDYRSKFYHAFSIIEFLEAEYTSKVKTTPILRADEAMEISEMINKATFAAKLNKEGMDRVKGATTAALTKLTKESRAEKLSQIINDFFKITSVKYVNQYFAIGIDFCKNVITLRNGLFHGKPMLGSFQNVNTDFKQNTDLLILINQKILDHFVYPNS